MTHDLFSIGSVPLVGCEVPEADGGEGDEAEVRAVQEAPALPHLEEEGAADDVCDHEDDGEQDGDRLPAVVNVGLLVAVVVVILRLHQNDVVTMPRLPRILVPYQNEIPRSMTGHRTNRRQYAAAPYDINMNLS